MNRSSSDLWSSTPWSPVGSAPRRDPLPSAPRRVPLATAWALRSHGALATIGYAFLVMGLLMATAVLDPVRVVGGPLASAMGEVAPGEVREVRETNVSVNEETVWAVEASFEAAGVPRRVTSYTVHPSVGVGARVPVHFVPSMPGLAVVEGLESSAMPLWAVPFVLLFPLVGLGFVAFTAVRGGRWVRLLEQGVEAEGTLVSTEPTGTRINDEPVLALTFHFRDSAGDTWPAVARAVDTSRLTDEPTERILYLPRDPRQSIVVDEIPPWLELDGRGFGPPPPSVRTGVWLRVGAVVGAVAVGLWLQSVIA